MLEKLKADPESHHEALKGLYELYIKRLQYFVQKGVPDNWDGVFTHMKRMDD